MVEEDTRQRSKTAGCIIKEDAEWYQESISNAFDKLKSSLLKGEPLNVLVENFMLEICSSMQHIKLQPDIGLAEIKDIIDTIADKEGTALKSMLQRELVLSKEVWQRLTELKLEVTLD